MHFILLPQIISSCYIFNVILLIVLLLLVLCVIKYLKDQCCLLNNNVVNNNKSFNNCFVNVTTRYHHCTFIFTSHYIAIIINFIGLTLNMIFLLILIGLKEISIKSKLNSYSINKYLLSNMHIISNSLFILLLITFSNTISALSNLMNVYIFGYYVVIYSLIIFIDNAYSSFTAMFFLLYLSKYQQGLFIIFLLDIFSHLFQSITVSNRLTINILAGGLLSNIISITMIISFEFYRYISLVNAIIIFVVVRILESLNYILQYFIFNIMSVECSIIMLLLVR